MARLDVQNGSLGKGWFSWYWGWFDLHPVRWIGHVIHMPETCLSEQILCSKLSSGNYKGGGQRKRFKDSLKQHLHKTNICDLVFDNWQLTTLRGTTPKAWVARTLRRKVWCCWKHSARYGNNQHNQANGSVVSVVNVVLPEWVCGAMWRPISTNCDCWCCPGKWWLLLCYGLNCDPGYASVVACKEDNL